MSHPDVTTEIGDTLENGIIGGEASCREAAINVIHLQDELALFLCIKTGMMKSLPVLPGECQRLIIIQERPVKCFNSLAVDVGVLL